MKNARIGLFTLLAWMPLALAVGAPSSSHNNVKPDREHVDDRELRPRDLKLRGAAPLQATTADVSRRIGLVPSRSGSAVLRRKVGQVARGNADPLRSGLNAQSFGDHARPVNRSRGPTAVANAGTVVDRPPATRGAARAYLPPSSNVTARLPPAATGLRPVVNQATLGGPAVGRTHSLAIGGSQLRHKL